MAPSNEKNHKTLKQLKEETNPSQLGDPISLKAETSDTQPTENDKPNKDGKPATESKGGKPNPSQIGDPVSLKAETSKSEPTDQDRGSKETSKNAGNGKPKM